MHFPRTCGESCLTPVGVGQRHTSFFHPTAPAPKTHFCHSALPAPVQVGEVGNCGVATLAYTNMGTSSHLGRDAPTLTEKSTLSTQSIARKIALASGS